jgi:hypothetical protein
VTYFTPTHAPVQAFPFVHFANSLSKEQQGYFPLTVLRLPLNKVVLDYTAISSVINDYLSMDDVLTSAWCHVTPLYARTAVTPRRCTEESRKMS